MKLLIEILFIVWMGYISGFLLFKIIQFLSGFES